MERVPDSLSRELQAMAEIGQILSDLADPAARQRVLKWAADRFALEEAPKTASGTPDALSDPDLAVDCLGGLFAAKTAQAEVDDLGEFAAAPTNPETAPAPDTTTRSLEAVIRSFAEDFERFAKEWNGAAA